MVIKTMNKTGNSFMEQTGVHYMGVNQPTEQDTELLKTSNEKKQRFIKEQTENKIHKALQSVKDSTDLEIMPLFTNIMFKFYETNPYVKIETSKGGLILGINDHTFKNPDSGEQDKEEVYIACGEVIEVGPDCKYVKPGDDIFVIKPIAKPIPFMNQGFFLTSEQNVMCIINKNLKERYGR